MVKFLRIGKPESHPIGDSSELYALKISLKLVNQLSLFSITFFFEKVLLKLVILIICASFLLINVSEFFKFI